VIPTPLAMYALLKQHYGGDLSAMRAANYEGDGVKLRARGAYYVALLTYAAIFGESPEGKVLSHYLTIGLNEGAATALQRLALAMATTTTRRSSTAPIVQISPDFTRHWARSGCRLRSRRCMGRAVGSSRP